MKKLDWIIGRRRELATKYTAALADHPWLQPPHVPDYAEPSFQSYAVTLTNQAPISRNELMQRLLDAGASTRRGIMLSHREGPYSDKALPGALSQSESASDRSLLLPLFPAMTDADQQIVISVLRRALAAITV